MTIAALAVSGGFTDRVELQLGGFSPENYAARRIKSFYEQSFTACFWMRIHTTPATSYPMASCAIESGSGWTWRLQADAVIGGQADYGILNATTGVIVTTANVPFTVGAWQFWALGREAVSGDMFLKTFDETGVKLGESLNPAQNAGSINVFGTGTDQTRVQLGGSNTIGTGDTAGYSFSDFRYYGRVLTDEELAQVMWGGHLVDEWPLFHAPLNGYELWEDGRPSFTWLGGFRTFDQLANVASPLFIDPSLDYARERRRLVFDSVSPAITDPLETVTICTAGTLGIAFSQCERLSLQLSGPGTQDVRATISIQLTDP